MKATIRLTRVHLDLDSTDPKAENAVEIEGISIDASFTDAEAPALLALLNPDSIRQALGEIATSATGAIRPAPVAPAPATSAPNARKGRR